MNQALKKGKALIQQIQPPHPVPILSLSPRPNINLCYGPLLHASRSPKAVIVLRCSTQFDSSEI